MLGDVVVPIAQSSAEGERPRALSGPLAALMAQGPVAQWIRHRPTEPGIAGSSPGGVILTHASIDRAAIAQVGERSTGDLKVPGSIPGLGIHRQSRDSSVG